jgi:polysaccharide export outer membrane protein
MTNIGKSKSPARLRLPIIFLVVVTIAFVGCTGSAFTSSQTHPGSIDTLKTQSRSNTSSLEPLEESQNADIIKPGDQLEITVWGYPEFNTTSTVKELGTVTVPLIGEVVAAGMTSGDFTEAFKQRLAAYVKGDTRVTVSHLEINLRISVLGSVTKQANYPVLKAVSLLEIIAEAGGLTSDADLRHVRIFRNGNNFNNPKGYEEVDLIKCLEKGDIQGIPKVRPGDTVFVPEEDDFIKDLATFGAGVILFFGFSKL